MMEKMIPITPMEDDLEMAAHAPTCGMDAEDSSGMCASRVDTWNTKLPGICILVAGLPYGMSSIKKRDENRHNLRTEDENDKQMHKLKQFTKP